MAIVLGVDQVLDKFNKKLEQARQDEGINVVVGFAQNYAVFVHEILTNFHPVGQAKFLEQPAREKRAEIVAIIQQELKKGKTLSQAMLMGGLFLQREAQLHCPVLTGALKNSAFTKLEKEDGK